jgi:uncharacterized protein YndB with AHSA1/START domain
VAKYQVRFEQYFAAPRAKVFAFFANHENLKCVWGGRFRRIRDATEGKNPNGLGSVREIKLGFSSFEETIVKFMPPSVIEYTVTRGSPIKNHLGRLVFADADHGTKLDYTISFDPRIPFTGWLIARVLSGQWRTGVNRAVKEIAQSAAA